MELDIGSLGVLALMNLLAMFSCGVSGFGENIIFQLGWYGMSLLGLSSGQLLQSVTILAVVCWPLAIMQAFLTWRFVNGGLAATMGAAQCLACVLGVALLVHFDNVWTKRCLGAVLLLLWLWQLVLEERVKGNRPEATGNFEICKGRNLLMAIVTGVCAGLLSGLFSTPGPANMVFVLLARIRKDEWRSTQAVIGFLQMPIRLTAITAGSSLQNVTRLWPEMLVSFVFGFFGLLLGNCAAPHVSEKVFRELIFAFLLLGGLTMLTAETGQVTAVALALACVGSAISFARSSFMYTQFSDSDSDETSTD